MLRFLALLVVGVVSAGTVCAIEAIHPQSGPQELRVQTANKIIWGGDGGEFPFPFGSEIPFPWSSIEGSWQIDAKGLQDVLRFKVERTVDGARLLHVKHIDGTTGYPVATGVGIENEDGKLVSALMRGPQDLYKITVRAFYRDLKARTKITVLTIEPVEGSPNMQNHYLLRKISSTTD